MRSSLPGYSLGIVIIIGALLLGGALAAYSSFKTQVLGATSQKPADSFYSRQSGVLVKVTSPKNSWNLEQFLCKTLQECLQSEKSGQWWASVSGAATDQNGHEVVIESSSSWQDYKFMKFIPSSVSSAASMSLETELEILNSFDGSYTVAPSEEGFYIVEFISK